MVSRCNNVGVRIYVDIILNHMSTDSVNPVGTGGNRADPSARSFPAVPYSVTDFNTPCSLNDYSNIYQVRNCELIELRDLNQSVPWVRDRIADFLDKLVEIGVAGFRIDAAKHMWPGDLEVRLFLNFLLKYQCFFFGEDHLSSSKELEYSSWFSS